MNIPWGADTSNSDDTKQIQMVTGTQDIIIDPMDKVNNTIFFYSDVYRDTILKLNKEILILNNELLNTSLLHKTQPAEIYINIQSYGGSIYAGLSAMDTILNSKIKINTVVDGCAASAATLISVVGNKRYMKKHSFILIHQLSSMFWGNYEQLKDEMDNAHNIMRCIKDIYKKHTKFPMKRLDEILKHDIWLDSKDALNYGLIDYII